MQPPVHGKERHLHLNHWDFWDAMGGMSEIAESKQEKSVHQRPLLLFPWESYSTSAFQASSLGLYYTLLKIHVSNVSKTSFLPHCPATPFSVFQKRTDMPMAPSGGEHNPRGQSKAFNYDFWGVKPSWWLPCACTAAWPTPAGCCSDAKSKGSYDHEPQMNILA